MLGQGRRLTRLSRLLWSDTSLLFIMVAGLIGIGVVVMTMPAPRISNTTMATVAQTISATLTPSKAKQTTSTSVAGPDQVIEQTTPSSQPEAVSVPIPAGITNPPACDSNQRVFVPVGGTSCSYTVSVPVTYQWQLPENAVYQGGSSPNAVVYVVIETPSQTQNGPFTANSITFHYAASKTAALGDYNVPPSKLTFSLINPDGSLTYVTSQWQPTVIASE